MSDPERAAPGERRNQPAPPETRDRRASRLWTLAALVVFGLANVLQFHEFWGRDLGDGTLLPGYGVYEALAHAESPAQPVEHWDLIAHNDLRFVTWLISRNARTLLTRPSQLFDAEVCYPTEGSLALGEPGISLGAVAIPGYLLSDSPIAIFNASLMSLPLISALAMFLLVRDWSGSPEAGIAAGLLYGFHVVKTWDVVHPYVWDTAWTVLALWFAVRLFERARWRDALGLAACTTLQIAGSFYALLSAVAIALPFMVWLVWRYGLGRARLLRLGVAAALTMFTAWFVLEPYLELRSAGVLEARTTQHFLLESWVGPGGVLFLGWSLIGLAALGLLSKRSHCLRMNGDPRWALAASGGLLYLLAAGGPVDAELGRPAPWFDAFGWLAPVVPGLDVIRSPASLYAGTHLALCILAGLGGAALLQLVPERARATAAIAWVLGVSVAVFLPRIVIAPDTFGYRFASIRPDPRSLRFFETLSETGNSGPILEVPVPPYSRVPRVTESVLLSFYHERQTSACYNSYLSPELEDARRAAKALPGIAGVRSARRLGFTTILVHHDPESPFANQRRAHFERFAAAHPDGPLIPLHASESMSAYAIDPVADRGRRAGSP